MLRIIIDGPRDPHYNMAIDEAIMGLRPYVKYDTLRIYMWSPSGVSIGRSQDALRAVKIEEIKRLGFKLVRRPTGGGALLHPENDEITYSVVLSLDNQLAKIPVDESASSIAKGIIDALQIIGSSAKVKDFGDKEKHDLCYLRRGSSDVILGGKKISGSAQVRNDKALLQHGTLLLRFEPEVWLRVINAPGYDHEMLRSRIAGLYEFMDVKIEKIIDSLVKGFSKELGDETFIGSLTPEEVQLSLELYQKKYSNDLWNLKGSLEQF
ncbi:lipoate--protein ligase family protein [Sulfolobus acidocaldarius]|uniref:Biotin/lipoate A/B protein ligase family protein n=4 Tax=Sulfolobus acidocaldarius TaxID=2285 RepID=Q4JBV3_SULAC|nr:biotin/lipoate A/B protein ligase family protein [Sulfolobus acidocaldarius]AAY79726.1 biotin/lipoate A/B protein ligase family protein [Sulfolobus acidocaldarius DSM 639]AGE70285.1 biotin/lipoate A/B protein ligase [Sulfolobus acidocaldarius N8]AGE72560.1 biotin/lipoate A/B protein ligase [Sulfolobus acidocaldarius Ron12/I]ALU29314.1 ligase [Sulfolobus acidocaldarius]ALU32043.1 ligase [Sulfolobus acidocaldarius]